MKMKRLLMICLVLTFVAITVNASSIYAGNSHYYDFQDESEDIHSIDYEIVNIDNEVKLDIDTNSTGAIISIREYSALGDFEIEFTINGDKKVTVINSPTSTTTSSPKPQTLSESKENKTFEEGIFNTRDNKTPKEINESKLPDKKESSERNNTWRLIRNSLIFIVLLLGLIEGLIYLIEKHKIKKVLKEESKNFKLDNELDNLFDQLEIDGDSKELKGGE